MTAFQKAWDAWTASKEGRTCLDPSGYLRADILENRLFAAFAAGFVTQQKHPKAKRPAPKRSALAVTGTGA